MLTRDFCREKRKRKKEKRKRKEAVRCGGGPQSFFFCFFVSLDGGVVLWWYCEKSDLFFCFEIDFIFVIQNGKTDPSLCATRKGDCRFVGLEIYS